METKKIVIKGDPYTGYFKILSVVFALTPMEQKVAAELLREFDKLRAEASIEIANEVLFSSRISKEIRERLELKEAAYNNLKSSLNKKKIIIDNKKLAPSVRLSYLLFEYEQS